MTSTTDDSTNSEVQKMPLTEAYCMIAVYLLVASLISSFLIGFLWFPTLAFAGCLRNCIENKCNFQIFGDASYLFLIIKIMVMMAIAALIFGLFATLPLTFIGAAVWMLLYKYNVKGLLPLISVGAIIAFIYSLIVFHFSGDYALPGNSSAVFNFLLPLGAVLTILMAYPKLKTIELK